MEIDLRWTKEEKEIFSQVQMEICDMKANGCSLERIANKINFHYKK